MLVDPTGRQRLWTPRRCTLRTLLIKERFVFPPLTVAAPYWGIHEGLTSSHSVRSERKNIFCLSCTLPPSCSLSASLSCCGAQLSLLLRAIYAKVNAVRCTPAIDFQGFRKNRITRVCEGPRLRFNSSPPGNQEVGGSACEGNRNAPTGSCQSLDELEFVRYLRADGEKLLCASHRDPSDRQVLQLSTQRPLVYTVRIFLTPLETGSALCWIVLLLHRTQPTAQQTTHKPFWILFVTYHGYFQQENILVRNHTVSRLRNERWIRGFCLPSLSCRLSGVAEALRGETHGSLCPKGAVAL